MKMIRITGLDLSLTGTGIAHIDVQAPPTIDPTVHVSTHTITSTGRKNATLPERVSRRRRLRNAIVDAARDSHLVVLEGPAYAANVGAVWDRAGLWCAVVDSLDHLGVPYVDVAPARVKKFAADKGSADKAAVAAGMVRLWGDLCAPQNDNEFDSLALCSLGAIHVARRQLPIRLLDRHLEVVSSITWPKVARP